MNPDLALALELADVADAITLARFRARDLTVETKADLTPVTEADRVVEETLRRRLAAARPHDAVLGEEQGGPGGADGGRWVIDPIDGTKNYIRGIPVYATLIARQQEDETVVGVVSAPALASRWWASRGEGAFANGRRIRVSSVREPGRAMLSYDSVEGFAEHGLEERFLALARRCWRTRAFGDFWSHVLVAEGAVDIAVEPEVEPWDLAPLAVIVEEAGGRFSDLSGVPRVDGGNALSTNGLLHAEVLAALAG